MGAAAGRRSAGHRRPSIPAPCLTGVRRRHRIGECGASSDPGAPPDGPAGRTPTLAATWRRDLDRQGGGGRVTHPRSAPRRQLGPREQHRALEEPSKAGWSWRTPGVLDCQPDLPNSPPAARPPWTWRGCAGTSLGAELLIRPPISRTDHLGDPASPARDARSQQGDWWEGSDIGARSGAGLPGACPHLHLPGRGPGPGQCVPRGRVELLAPDHVNVGEREPLSLQRLNLGGKKSGIPAPRGYCLTSYPPPRPPTLGDTCQLGIGQSLRRAQVPERSLLCREA